MKKKVVIFDFDHTFIKGDSIIIAALFSSNYVNLILRVIEILPYVFLHKIGAINTKNFKEKFLKVFNICNYFNKKDSSAYIKKIKQIINKKALARLKYHKKNNDLIYFCSASPRMLIHEITNYLDVGLICTELVRNKNKWVPRIIGENCNGKQKVKKVKEKLGPLEDIILEVYGDSFGDKELLEISDIPHFRSFSEDIRPYSR